MKANEIFRKLGFIQHDLWNDKKEQYGTSFHKDFGNKEHEVRFMFKDKTVQCSKIFYDNKMMWSFAVSLELDKAIQEKKKELGWIE